MRFKIDAPAPAPTNWQSPLAGAVICAGLAAGGLFVAFSGESLQGGIPFLPDPINQVAGRLLFGCGALITAAMAVYALRDFFRAVRKRPPR